MGFTSTSISERRRAHISLRSGYMDPCTTPARSISPFKPAASMVLSNVTSREPAVRSLLQSGSAKISRTVPISDPMSRWNSTMSRLIRSTSPYIWDWKVPESVMMIPG